MHVVIVGGGRTGKKLAERLLKGHHQVTIVEKNEKRANELKKELKTTVIHGNGAEMGVLERIGAGEADSLAAVTGADDVNLMACTIAKKLNIPNVVTRVNDSRNANLFQDAGVNAIIGFPATSVDLYERTLIGGGIYGKLGLSIDKANATEVTVVKGSEAEGKRIKELNLPELCTVGLIVREGELIPAVGDTKLRENDRIVLVGRSKDVVSAIDLFRKS